MSVTPGAWVQWRSGARMRRAYVDEVRANGDLHLLEPWGGMLVPCTLLSGGPSVTLIPWPEELIAPSTRAWMEKAEVVVQPAPSVAVYVDGAQIGWEL